MHGNYFSLGTLVQRNPISLFPPCFSACTLSLTFLSAFWFMQLLGQFRAPAGEQSAIEGLFSGPQLNRFPGDGATEWTGRTCNKKHMAFPPAQCKTRQHAWEILALIKSMVTCSNSVRILPQINFFFCVELRNLLFEEQWLVLFCKAWLGMS